MIMSRLSRDTWIKSVAELLHVCMTMDVERIAEQSPTGGPPDWDFAERSARAYCEILHANGLRATLFIVPDTARRQPDLYLDLAETTGAELDMHLHPQCWRDRYLHADRHDYLGGYAGQAQLEMLEVAKAEWMEAIGFEPASFRGGNFSANDETFAALVEAGFTHGSVSQPGRAVTWMRAVWSDAIWDVHRPHRAFRGAVGDLDFIEVPLTSDRAQHEHWTGVGDVRLESAEASQVSKAARQEVMRQVGEDIAIKHVCILTHNFVNYWSSEGDGSAHVLRDTIESFQSLAADLGLEMVGSTTADVRRAYLKTEP